MRIRVDGKWIETDDLSPAERASLEAHVVEFGGLEAAETEPGTVTTFGTVRAGAISFGGGSVSGVFVEGEET